MKPTSEELFDREPDVGDYCLWGFLLFKVSSGLFFFVADYKSEN